jgi:hypothetical protein
LIFGLFFSRRACTQGASLEVKQPERGRKKKHQPKEVFPLKIKDRTLDAQNEKDTPHLFLKPQLVVDENLFSLRELR